MQRCCHIDCYSEVIECKECVLIYILMESMYWQGTVHDIYNLINQTSLLLISRYALSYALPLGVVEVRY